MKDREENGRVDELGLAVDIEDLLPEIVREIGHNAGWIGTFEEVWKYHWPSARFRTTVK